MVGRLCVERILFRWSSLVFRYIFLLHNFLSNDCFLRLGSRTNGCLACGKSHSSSTGISPPSIPLGPTHSVCRHTLPCCRVRRPLSRVSRKQRYNTLDFPAENRVPIGMLAPLLESQRQRGGDPPLNSPYFLRSVTKL